MSRDAEVLNRLIIRLRATAEGYRRAASDGETFGEVLTGAASSHARTAEELAAAVRALGETASGASGFDLGGYAVADIPAALPQGEAATAQAIERAEAELKAEFDAAMADPATSGPVRDAVLRAYDEVKPLHDAALQRLDALGV